MEIFIIIVYVGDKSLVENKISNRLKCDEIENSQCSIYAALLYVLKVHGLLRIAVKKSFNPPIQAVLN